MRPNFSPITASVIVGVVWAPWHAPLWIFGDFIPDLPAAVFIPLYVLSLVAMSLVITALHLRSAGSVMVSMLAHGVLNTTLLPFESLRDDGVLTASPAWPLTVTVVLTAFFLVAVNRKDNFPRRN